MSDQYSEEEDRLVSWFKDNFKNIIIGIIAGASFVLSYNYYIDSNFLFTSKVIWNFLFAYFTIICFRFFFIFFNYKRFLFKGLIFITKNISFWF